MGNVSHTLNFQITPIQPSSKAQGLPSTKPTLGFHQQLLLKTFNKNELLLTLITTLQIFILLGISAYKATAGTKKLKLLKSTKLLEIYQRLQSIIFAMKVITVTPKASLTYLTQ